MNIIKRTLIILVAAFAVIGALVAVSNSSVGSSLSSQQTRNRPAVAAQSTGTTANAGTTTQPPRGEREGGASGLMGIVSVLSDLLIVAVIVVPVQLVTRLINKQKQRADLKPS